MISQQVMSQQVWCGDLNFANPTPVVLAHSRARRCEHFALQVTRDRLMVELDSAHPGYGFAVHKVRAAAAGRSSSGQAMRSTPFGYTPPLTLQRMPALAHRAMACPSTWRACSSGGRVPRTGGPSSPSEACQVGHGESPALLNRNTWRVHDIYTRARTHDHTDT